jgi:DNA-binding CsgD family transcriptional regulator
MKKEGRRNMPRVTPPFQFRQHADFHPPEFVQERLALINRVLKENKPLAIGHIYHGRSINSIIWPIRDRTPPYNRVLVVSRPGPTREIDEIVPNAIETVATNYIGLGPLDVLTQRELEVAVLIGHGMSVPGTAQVLHRSPKTVERHKEAIAKKLRMHSQAQLVQAITTMGLKLEDTALKRFTKIDEIR